MGKGDLDMALKKLFKVALVSSDASVIAVIKYYPGYLLRIK